MKRTCWAIVVLLAGHSVLAAGDVIDRIVAVVEDSPILLSEVEEAMAFARAGGDTTSEEELRERILEQLIDDRVVIETAKREGIEAPPMEVEQETLRREQQLREQFLTTEDFTEQLEQEGLTEAQFRRLQEEMARDQILARKMLETVRPTWKVEVTTAEVDSFYGSNLDQLPVEPERVELCHLLVRVGVDVEEHDRVRSLAEELKRRAEAGEDFAELAREFGTAASAARGGDLGLIGRGQVLPEFEEAVFALEPGDVGGPVRTRLGYHVIKVEEKEGDRVRARHILLTLESGEEQRRTARARADSLWKLIATGAPFDDLVKEASDDSATRDTGGCVGTVRLPSLPQGTRAVLDTLGVGRVSPPLEDEDGYHLYLLQQRVPAGPASLSELRPRIRLVLQQRKLEEKYRQWVTRLKEEMYVSILDVP
jgi:peptidyl-prolyl cis-trans isomerase SurA